MGVVYGQGWKNKHKKVTFLWGELNKGALNMSGDKNTEIGAEEAKNLLLDDGADVKNMSFFSRVRGYFLAGIFVTAPIGITIYLTWIFLRFIDARVTAVIPPQFNPFNYLPFSVPGIELFKAVISLVIAIAFFIMLGWFAKNFLGRLIYNIAEYVVHRMPVINTIYKAIKQIMETIMASQSQAFREVVMLEYPRKGVWSIGFLTGHSKGEVQRVTENETLNVFVPTTPNPTSGYLLFVPKREVVFSNMTAEDAAKLIVSAGIITPPDRAAAGLLDEDQLKTTDAAKAPDYVEPKSESGS